MIELRQRVDNYVTLRRSLGFKIYGYDRLLYDFVDYLDRAGASTVTTPLALAWATTPIHAQPIWWKKRLSLIRGFSRYLCTLDPLSEVPPPGLLADRYRRPTPYLYSEAEVTGLLAAAGTLSPLLRAVTHQTLFGLLAVSGMRLGEAIRLDRTDVDLEAGLIRIRETKFNKSRQLPLHITTVMALKEYVQQRERLGSRPRVPSFFVSTRGTRLIAGRVSYVFAQLASRIGLQPRDDAGRPRLHGLRHTFAVTTLRDWYRAGEDVMSKLPILSAIWDMWTQSLPTGISRQPRTCWPWRHNG